MKKYAVYIRVSTQKQGRSGLGLESQQKICEDFIRANDGEKVEQFMDVESGTHRDRKGLLNAIDYCKQNGCALVIAKLDRLARDVEFCFKVINTGIEIHFCDMPQINTLLLGVFASVAQYERELTSDRTKKALAVKKAKGCKLGGASDKYKLAISKKSEEQITSEYEQRGKTKNSRHKNSRDVQAFLKVLRNVFPEATKNDNPYHWYWGQISTKGNNKTRILSMMRDYSEIDRDLFQSWDFSDVKKSQTKLRGYIQATYKSIKN